ncbi:serine threonine-kinase TIO [Pelomyxa schiedti]|nr:serine threonine-kinase TIO [Pelomyxa schiedti]
MSRDSDRYTIEAPTEDSPSPPVDDSHPTNDWSMLDASDEQKPRQEPPGLPPPPTPVITHPDHARANALAPAPGPAPSPFRGLAPAASYPGTAASAALSTLSAAASSSSQPPPTLTATCDYWGKGRAKKNKNKNKKKQGAPALLLPPMVIPQNAATMLGPYNRCSKGGTRPTLLSMGGPGLYRLGEDQLRYVTAAAPAPAPVLPPAPPGGGGGATQQLRQGLQQPSSAAAKTTSAVPSATAATSTSTTTTTTSATTSTSTTTTSTPQTLEEEYLSHVFIQEPLESLKSTNEGNGEGPLEHGTYPTVPKATRLANLEKPRKSTTAEHDVYHTEADSSTQVNWDGLHHFMDELNEQALGNGTGCPEPVVVSIPTFPAATVLSNEIQQLMQYLWNTVLLPPHFVERRDLKYTDKDLIGAGSFGRVYKATFGATNTAVKVIDIRKTYDQDGNLGILEKEVMNHRSLSHPNLVSFIGVCLDESTKEFSIIFEHMECSLAAFISDPQKLPPQMLKYRHLAYGDKLSILDQMLRVVIYLHEQAHMVHCDFKPDNFLIDANLTVKLCDLGFVKLISESMGRASGTAPYMAPELLKNTDYQPSSPESDMWAMAFTMWELLYQQPSFDRSERLDSIMYNRIVLAQHPDISKDIPDPNSPVPIPPCLVTMFQQCWHTDPYFRLTATKAHDAVMEAMALNAVRKVNCTPTPTPELAPGFFGRMKKGLGL